MDILEYFETRAGRAKVNMTIAGRGTILCRPSLVFNEKGRPIGVNLNNQLIPETHINIEET